jgi:hypothetical protein
MGGHLSALQDWMIDALVQKKPIAEIPELAAQTPAHIAGNDRLSPIEQLDIYRDQFWLRHLDAMYEDYVTLGKLVGWDAFEEMCTGYFAKYPPRDFSLRDLGKDFARFLAETEPYASDRLLADVARAEWAFVDAFDGPDAPPLEMSSVATAPEDAWPRARIALHPALQRLALAYPAHDLREAARTNKEAKSVDRPEMRRVNVVIYRGEGNLQYIEVDDDEFALLDELAEGAPLGEACERAMKRAGVTDVAAFEAKIGAWFQRWAARGWVGAVRFE